MLDNDQLKGKLRKQLRGARRGLSAADHASRSKLAASFVARLPAFKAGSRIAVYLPFDRETDPSALIAAARRRRVRVYVPVVECLRHRRLRFYPLTAKTRRGAFGISIPHAAVHRNAVGPRWFDLIAVPLVGVDRLGRRLGMGGGFYDRALVWRRQRRHWLGPRLVGLAFDCQRTESVSALDHDVRLDALATESGIEFYRGDR
ncbi:MAG: 5-formyltetrahydrofolate cyclo-ligase [Steroidobacteraceae bacterium]|jgi:5-formyltetrahydrofolate cyclo-ligase